MTLHYFLVYFFILFVATITPGPSMLLAVNHGVNYGIFRTTYSGLGNLIGNLLMALVSMLGLGAVLIASGVVFNIIKWAGVAYLVFIGLKMIFDPVKNPYQEEDRGNKTIKSGWRLFAEGFLIAIGNPKGILFFTALFPQFINIKSATWSEFMIILVTLGAVAYGCYMLYALFGVKLNRLFRVYSFRKFFNRITGCVFIGTGLVIAFSRK